ncbi:hypothetical protein TWF694_007499 [Orbilia ellipsospora]|uniref:Uncharacterized protein n=1 Tax=Orbilia ellipsospora TaxID=2528407 RepID=A0AAV9XJE5_9PEZI
MQNSYQQATYEGTEAYIAVPHSSPERVSTESDNHLADTEKAAPRDFNPSPYRNSIYLPLLKRRVSKKTFWIICGCVCGVILTAVIVGVAVGATNAKKAVQRGRGEKAAPSSSNGQGGNGEDPRGGSNDDSSSTDPCLQLADSGASTQAVSDCFYQEHLTRLEVIDNFDGDDDYIWTYSDNPYASVNRKKTTGLNNLNFKGTSGVHPGKNVAKASHKLKSLN